MPSAALELTATDIRERLRTTRLGRDPRRVDPDALAQLGNRPLSASQERIATPLRPAGVLIPVIRRANSLTVLFTRRSSLLRQHAGQISFPGGSMESSDQDVSETALREANEEIGLDLSDVEVAGFLPTTMTTTGFAITATIGVVHESFVARIDPGEVDSVFEVPLTFLLDEGNASNAVRVIDGTRYAITTFQFGEHRIWGATASIVVMLRHALDTA